MSSQPLAALAPASGRWHPVRAARTLVAALRPPKYPGMRLTRKRLFNYYLTRYQLVRGHTRLLARPLILTIEATNVCNLECPYCFTGAGEVARKRSMIHMPLYRRLMDELGDTAMHVEFYNWGEPLLNKNIHEMIRIASAKGCSTIISTNFSFPFDRTRAEALVTSGLAILGFGLDGATQESYEKYRVGGKLDLVLQNVKLLLAAKAALRSETPRICWSFHVFEHNRHEVEQARAMAADLGVEFVASKAWVAGEEWQSGTEFVFPIGTAPERCRYLWKYAVVNNDGRVASCAASFYQDDDFGSVEDTPFMQVWNNDRFRAARRMYQTRATDEAGTHHICHDCPYTIVWENYQQHLARGLPRESFDPVYTTNDWFNYFFKRRPRRDAEPAPRHLP